VTAVNYCRENNLKLAVRGKGAHSPYGLANDAVVVDLMNMTAVRVDPDKKLAFIDSPFCQRSHIKAFCSSV
jgi:FAD/FMN-containing dehydrogenase